MRKSLFQLRVQFICYNQNERVNFDTGKNIIEVIFDYESSVYFHNFLDETFV